jgi:hypothetical protein
VLCRYASLCITAAHYRQSTKFSKSPRNFIQIRREVLKMKYTDGQTDTSSTSCVQHMITVCRRCKTARLIKHFSAQQSDSSLELLHIFLTLHSHRRYGLYHYATIQENEKIHPSPLEVFEHTIPVYRGSKIACALFKSLPPILSMSAGFELGTSFKLH